VADGTYYIPKGWKEWKIAPESTDGPRADASDAEALNHMGLAGWELVNVELIVEHPPNGRDLRGGRHRRQYTFKRVRDPGRNA
jgi:hypothetical protein